MKFEDFAISDKLLNTIQKLGFTEPTEIQEKSIPHIMEGKNVIGESATGSGKTLAFATGIADKVIPRKGIQALVLTPTRELAEQVKDELKKLNRTLKTISVYGGIAINPQIENLKIADVVVGTPGRLLDHLQRGTIETRKVKLLVLDEADRMFDMGFIDDVKRIMQACKNRQQTLFFSATMLPKIVRLAKSFMDNPVNVSAKRHVDPSLLKQVYYPVPNHLKLSLLVHLYKAKPCGLAMVFCNTRHQVDFVVKNLNTNKIDAIAIHGGFTQNKRTRTLQKFHEGKAGILVCTDVAARGLHIEDVSHIYNYEIPQDPTDYVHRIGRTARAGEEGLVVNLLSPVGHESFSRVKYEYPAFNIKKMDRPYLPQINVARPSPRDRRNKWGDKGRNRSNGRNNGFVPRKEYNQTRNRSSFGNRSNSYNSHSTPKRDYSKIQL